MPYKSESGRNWFEQDGQAYARFRPQYPPELAVYLASLAPDNTIAVDVGCGNGQLTQLLALHFDSVFGLDSSEDQIANICAHERITYRCASANQLPLADSSASLITAAQAAHWFDLPKFYGEVRRIALPAAVLALISYGVLSLEPSLNDRFEYFYQNEIGPYWPPERKLVDTGYSSIEFPFQELNAPHFEIKVDWRLDEFLGYLQTWSALRRANEAGRADLFVAFAQDISSLWGDKNDQRSITWPINLRVGTL